MPERVIERGDRKACPALRPSCFAWSMAGPGKISASMHRRHGSSMRPLPSLLALMLAGCMAAPAQASNEPPVPVALSDVIATNARLSPICNGAAADPRRPDRIRLAQWTADLPDPNASYPFGDSVITPLAFAALADDVRLLDNLFARGAHWRKDPSDALVMYEAVQHGSPELVVALLRHGLDPDMPLPGGWSPIMAAAWQNRSDNVVALLDAGADVNAVLPGERTALGIALMCKNQGLVDLLIRRGAHPNAKAKRLAQKQGIDIPGS